MRTAPSPGLAALVVLSALACSGNTNTAVKPYSYPGCADNGTSDCAGQAAFTCAMDYIWERYASCTHTAECTVATGPDPANCFEPCVHAAINKNDMDAYNQDVKVEAYKYCNAAACVAYPYCPRPTNAIVACVDGGCTWVEGVWKLPDGGQIVPLDAGAWMMPDAAAPIPDDAGAPLPPGLDASAPPAGLDAAAPAGLDAATVIPPDADYIPPDADYVPPDADYVPPDADAIPPDAS